MTLHSIVKDSCFASIAHITEDSLDKLNLFMQYNLDLIKQFPHVIISTNSPDDMSRHIINQYHNTWFKFVPNCVVIHNPVNKGHMFGTIDLEESILNNIKKELPSIKYLWKSMDDVITTPQLLELEVEAADFYYLPGFSYESIIKAGGKDNLQRIFESYESGFWTPQTTFFILNLSGINNLYGTDVDGKNLIYQEAKARNPFIKPWEIKFDIKFDCETHLGRTTKDLKKYCLIKDQVKELLDMVEFNKIGDPSHKNIYFEKIGVCHYHQYKDLIYNV